MKMKFRGWSREVHVHDHEIKPVRKTGSGYEVNKIPDVKINNDEIVVLGRVAGLALTGDFLVELYLSSQDLSLLIQEKIAAEPIASLAFISDLQARALTAALELKSGNQA
jgi:hypothetical protein